MKPEERSDVFRGLANRWRRRIVDHLRPGPQSYDALQKVVPVSQGTLSTHLGILRDCGLIDSRYAGGQVSYHLNRRTLKRVGQWVQASGKMAS